MAGLLAPRALAALLLTGCLTLGPPPVTSPSHPAQAATDGPGGFLSPYPTPECDLGGPTTPAPGRDWQPIPFHGTGNLTLGDEHPVVMPGRDTTFELTFHNPDCRSFYYQGSSMCTGWLMTIGEGMTRLEWAGNGSYVSQPYPVPHSCGLALSNPWNRVPPGGSVRFTPTWNGSFRLVDHAVLERGEEWTVRDFWAAPGSWNMTYGAWQASYDVHRHATVRVESNERNAIDALQQGECGDGGGEPGPEFRNLTLEASSRRGSAGEPVTFWANYTMAFQGPGCRLLVWTPGLSTGSPAVEVLRDCSDRSSGAPRTLVRTPTGEVRGHMAWTWNGTTPCVYGGRPIGPGLHTFTFEPDLGGRRRPKTPLPNVTVAWA